MHDVEMCRLEVMEDIQWGTGDAELRREGESGRACLAWPQALVRSVGMTVVLILCKLA